MAMGMVIETLVAVLLMVTIGYCMLLNRRLQGLRADESALKQTIAELLAASEAAERAIAGLKQVAAESDQTLGGRLRRAGELNTQLAERISAGNEIVRRLGLITAAARTGRMTEEAPVSIGDQAAEAAERLSELRRARVAGVAA